MASDPPTLWLHHHLLTWPQIWQTQCHVMMTWSLSWRGRRWTAPDTSTIIQDHRDWRNDTFTTIQKMTKKMNLRNPTDHQPRNCGWYWRKALQSVKSYLNADPETAHVSRRKGQNGASTKDCYYLEEESTSPMTMMLRGTYSNYTMTFWREDTEDKHKPWSLCQEDTTGCSLNPTSIDMLTPATTVRGTSTLTPNQLGSLNHSLFLLDPGKTSPTTSSLNYQRPIRETTPS